MLELSSKERSLLRAAAHALKPVVMISEAGLNPAVIHEIDINLNAHGLIKVKVAGDERDNRLLILQQITQALDCTPVAHIGKVLTLYRALPQHAHHLKSEMPLERCFRHPNEAHTPKKRAAAGKKGPASKAKKASNNSSLGRSVKHLPKLRSEAKARPKRGSALSLRAGRRNAS